MSEPDAAGPKPPQMQRSVGQLTSSYAPMRHFAFENGLGVCLSVPLPASPASFLSGNTPDQIHRRLGEAAKAWYKEGTEKAFGENADPARVALLQHLVVDDSLYDPDSRTVEYRRDIIGLVEPKRMGYEIAPTTLVCGTCGLLAPCRSATRMANFLDQAEEKCQDPNGDPQDTSKCRWRQFEPIFVHPSGAWRSVEVRALEVFPGQQEPSRASASCEGCGCQQFKVDMSKVTLGGWFLKCARCGVKAGWTWTDNDEDYLRAQVVARGIAARGGPSDLLNLDDARMEKISYGASIAFIPQAETFVDLPNAEILQYSEAHRVEDLCGFIAGRVGYVAPHLAPEAAARELARGGPEAQALGTRIQRCLAAEVALRAVDAELADQQRDEASKAVAEAYKGKLLAASPNLPPEIREKITDRSLLWASRYDPFQLAIEHEALAETKLSGRQEFGKRRSFIRFVDPDDQLLPWRKGTEGAASVRRVEEAMTLLGMEEAGLIPGFELCRFTYGYSRTASGPRHPKRKIPVRLKLFPKVRVGDQPDTVHPVYVMRQKNEAFYFRLDSARVRAWLEALDCEDARLLVDEPSLAAALLRSLHPMDRFLNEHDRDAGRRPRLYAATYGLLHSMAHHVIRTMSRLSGLDEGGLGEYLFPLDLAFVVYRSGMTMDLGDLSSLWRNSWQAFVSELRAYPTSLGCNVGSLCAEQGAACPDCLMIPEVACVAGNRYLSRSLLTGEGHPAYMDTAGDRVRGYLELGLEVAGGAP